MEKFRKAMEWLKTGNGYPDADAGVVKLSAYLSKVEAPSETDTGDRVKTDRTPAEIGPESKTTKVFPIGNQQAQEVPKPGWWSPSYSKSRRSRIDTDIAGRQKCISALHDNRASNDYKFLRTQVLQRTRQKGWRTIMITSVLPGEGKTLTAINLAVAFALEYRQTVLLVDCNLKQQNIYTYLGLPGDVGLIDHLIDERPMSEVIVWPGIEKLTIISGGRNIQESVELLGAPKMQYLVAEMKHRYADRYLFFDVPSVLSSPDAAVFASIVDCVLLVVEHGKTREKDIARALKMIPAEKFLGFVLNRSPAKGK